ncbi:hypothetical protein ACQUSR_28120 [Streptomyces sp. P1-3]|uniref:hypothetical protein n=1 Tax=Streptomyces sp. P1-3 TaxID=3421658 RepID=UPI003D35EBF9
MRSAVTTTEAEMLKGTLTPEEFLRELQKEERGLSFPALIKPAETPDAFLVSILLTCDDWTVIPSNRIDGIEYLFPVPCKTHEHPLVRIHLKEPDSDEGKFYASLATALVHRGATTARPRRTAGASKVRPATGPLPLGGHRLPPLRPAGPGVGPGSDPDGPLVRVDEQACLLYHGTAGFLHAMALVYEAEGYHDSAELLDAWAYANDYMAGFVC